MPHSQPIARAATTGADVLLQDATDEQAAAWCAALADEGLVAVASSDTSPDARAVLLWARGGFNAGLARLRELRLQWPQQSLVLLAAAPRPVDEVLALEMGADAVYAADGSALVLAARLRALWRWQARIDEAAAANATAAATADAMGNSATRNGTAGNGATIARELRFGHLTINRDQRVVTLNAQAVPLTEGEFEVLWLLASHSGEPLSRAQLLQRLRGGNNDEAANFEGDRSIDSRVYRLRGKLGDRSRAAPGIRTVRHRGYLFAPAAW